MKKDFMTSIKEGLGKLKGDRLFVVIAVVCALICTILCIACFNSVSKATAGIETIVQEVQEMKQASAVLSERISQLEVTIDNTQASLNESAASKYIRITKQPSSVSTYIGRTDAMLFQIVCEGSNLTFTWQHYNESTGNWDSMVFDGSGFDTTNGLRLYNDAAAGTSELWTMNIVSAAFGSYRCMISDAAGTYVYSNTVQIVEKPAP